MENSLMKRFILSISLWLGLLSISVPLVVFAESSALFINKLKSHYQETTDIKAFSLTYRYLGKSDAYQSWDYQSPSRYKAYKTTEMDLINEHYFQHIVHHFTGGQLLDEVHFQNDTVSLRYEKNGQALGKRVNKQKMSSFGRYKNLIMMNVDFFAVRPLIEEPKPTENIKHHHIKMENKTRVTHFEGTTKEMHYVFGHNPIRLLSIHNTARKRRYIYDDYQTSKGITYARSLIKYYNGETIPSYINQLDDFEIIEQIEPQKFQLPSGFGPVIPKYDNALFSKAISPNLYIITSASNNRNILLKTRGDEITLFGAAGNRKHAAQIIKFVKEQFPTKNIAAVHVTHPYSDQISGLEAFVKLGAVIIADAYTVDGIKNYSRFSKNIANFNFDIIRNNDSIDGISFYVLENSRAKRQSFAYFEQEKLIFQTDFLAVPFDNTVTNVLPSYSKTFISFVKKHKLDVGRIVAHKHNNNISQETMNKYDNVSTM